jgi:hypothetical protein
MIDAGKQRRSIEVMGIRSPAIVFLSTEQASNRLTNTSVALSRWNSAAMVVPVLSWRRIDACRAVCSLRACGIEKASSALSLWDLGDEINIDDVLD